MDVETFKAWAEPVYPEEAPYPEEFNGLDMAAARHELWKHLNGYVSHLPEEDPDWRYWIEAIMRAAKTGDTTDDVR